ncbi:MAG: FAD-binding oxidoreductase [Parachlamydia sp.]|nr:FAD-binding oxidoreductase [Parachlamydia sp.]
MTIQVRNAQEKRVAIDDETLAILKAQIHGKVIAPEDAEYDEARKVWNAMIDRRPGLIVECTGTADVLYAVRFARQHNLLITVRGAGHNIAGRSLQNEVLLVDLSRMRYVHVNPEEKTAVVAPGATLADIDHETEAYGLALPMGINSTTGIGGLTLGGGFGWLSRTLGMTVDNLISVEAVTVAGERIVCDRDHHPDLFWALMGGGGNFAIVTSFQFRLHPVGPEVVCGPVVYDFAEAKKVLANYRAYCSSCPEKATVWFVLRRSPPFPFLPSSYHGKLVMIVVGCYNGPLDEGMREFAKLKKFGTPLGDAIAPRRLRDFQRSFDPLVTPGARNYWKTHNFKEIADGLIDVLAEYGQSLPHEESEIFIAQVGGETNRVPKDATAYPHRDVSFTMNVHTRWREEQDDKVCSSWARDFYKAVEPFATGGAYINFISEGDDTIEGAFAENAKRLAKVKAHYDPGNILRPYLKL